ncbi:MAG: hypothetical protein PHE49_06655 [bacterium]|nr:hypothetical protein [bacterium]
MILKKSLPWGQISGKLTLTPEQAKKMLDFDMRPDAKGVIFRQVKGKTVISNYTKHTFNVVTPKSKVVHTRVSVVTKLIKEHFNDLICPIWYPLAKGTKYYTGNVLFGAVNFGKRDMPPHWEKLVISMGELEKPDFRYIYCQPKNALIVKRKRNSSLVLALFDIREKKLYHPFHCTEKTTTIKLPFKHKYIHHSNQPKRLEKPDFIFFAYTMDNKEFSPSVSIIPKKCQSWTTKCNMCKRFGKDCKLTKKVRKVIVEGADK